jgi:hypothetical protein
MTHRVINDGAARVTAAAKAAGWTVIPGQWPYSAYLRHRSAVIHFEWTARGDVIDATTPMHRRLIGPEMAEQLIKEIASWSLINS